MIAYWMHLMYLAKAKCYFNRCTLPKLFYRYTSCAKLKRSVTNRER